LLTILDRVPLLPLPDRGPVKPVPAGERAHAEGSYGSPRG
jgi:hypothetical protein